MPPPRIPVGDHPVQSILWALLFTFAPGVPVTPGEISPLNPTNSDLIVDQWSQRNADKPLDYPNAAIGDPFEFHLHMEIGGMGAWESEARSILVRERIRTKLGETKPFWGSGVLDQ